MNQFSDRFQQELLPGESIHWTGQPSRKVVFHKQDLFLIPFSLLWGGFAIFWEAGVLGWWGDSARDGQSNWFMALWGVPFIVVGQYLIWGRFVHAAWAKARIFYAVTDRRVLIVSTGLSRGLNAGLLANIPVIQKEVRADGIGTLTFGAADNQENNRNTWGAWSGISIKGTPTFADIENAEQVHALVTRLQQETRAVKTF